MNWVLLVVAAILLGYTVAGYVKGFLKIIYSLVSWILIWIFVVWATPQIHDYLIHQTNLYENVVGYCEEMLRKQVSESMEENQFSLESLGEVGANLPAMDSEVLGMLAERLPEGVLEDVMTQMQETTQGVLDNSELYTKAAVAVADLIIQGVSVLIAVIAGAIVSAMVSMVLGFVGNLPLIGFANRICGLAAGAANGLLVVWIAFYLVALWSATEFGSTITSYIYANEFLMFLYEKNLLLTILM